MVLAPPLIIELNREHFYLNYTDQDLQNTTLGQLKEVCRAMTGVPSNNMKVVFNGGVMKDDNSSLDRYGIYVGAKLKLTGTQTNRGNTRPMTKDEKEEHQSIQKLDHIVQEASDQLLEKMQSYMANAQLFRSQFVDTGSETYQAMLKTTDGFFELKETERQKLHKDYVFVTETLMQALLKIDNISLDGSAELGRSRRRQAVRQLQGWLDQMDHVRNSLKDE